MNYLLDRRNKKRKLWGSVAAVVILIILFYFRSGIFGGLSGASHATFRPFFAIGNKFGDIGEFFSSRSALDREIENLKLELDTEKAKSLNYDALFAENTSLKEVLERSTSNNLVVSAILAKPNQSPYDTLIIDIGTNHAVAVGNTVFALGNIPIGKIAEVYDNSSKVVLFSTPGEKTEVVVGDKNVFMQITGRGGGNFEMITPQDFTISHGEEAVLPGILPHVVAVVEEVISDPRDASKKILLVSPVNVQELKFVEVRK